MYFKKTIRSWKREYLVIPEISFAYSNTENSTKGDIENFTELNILLDMVKI